MKNILYVFLILLGSVSSLGSANDHASTRQEPPTYPPAPNFDELTKEIKLLQDSIATLTESFNQHGGAIAIEWRRSNGNFEKAVQIVEERYTVGTLVGIAIAVGLAPAIVHALSLPLVYILAKRGAMAGSSPATL